MRAVRAMLSVLAILLALGLAVGVVGLMGKLLISGAGLLGSWGSVSLSEESAPGPEQAIETFSPVEPASTVPPGDDPSWSLPMDSAPVDQTADELAKSSTTKSE